MKLTTTTVRGELPRPLKVIIASDLHDRKFGDSLGIIKEIKPDLILCPGDMMEDAAEASISEKRGFLFMKQAAEVAPLAYSLGNHELGMSRANADLLRNAGIHLLDDDSVTLDGICIGGLTSGFVRSIRRTGTYASGEPNRAFIQRFSELEGFKLLLCHHPEYYEPYLRPTSVNVIVSGHAHGGQWRVFGLPIFAPGQGIFPRYTSGFYGNKMFVSRGITNPSFVPRIGNKTELVFFVNK